MLIKPRGTNVYIDIPTGWVIFLKVGFFCFVGYVLLDYSYLSNESTSDWKRFLSTAAAFVGGGFFSFAGWVFFEDIKKLIIKISTNFKKVTQ